MKRRQLEDEEEKTSPNLKAETSTQAEADAEAASCSTTSPPGCASLRASRLKRSTAMSRCRPRTHDHGICAIMPHLDSTQNSTIAP